MYFITIILRNYAFTFTHLLVLLLSLFFLHEFFLKIILKTNENVTSCNKDVNKKYLKHTQSLHLLRHERKLLWLGNELGRWISKLFDAYRPNHHWRWRLDDKLLIVPTKFIHSNKIGRWNSCGKLDGNQA